MTEWDPHALRHLDRIEARIEDAGLSGLIQTAAADLWRANRERYEPDHLFDDPFTLSVLTSRNLANRLFAEINEHQEMSKQGIVASRESSTTVVTLSNVAIRLVKAPHYTGRNPDFDTAFVWDRSDLRLGAAARNHAAYAPQGHPTLFDVDDKRPAGAVSHCLDVFIVWAADLSTGLTAGWLGLPTIKPTGSPWLAVRQLWWDAEVSAATDLAEETENDGNGGDFAARPLPVPALRLRSVRSSGAGL